MTLLSRLVEVRMISVCMATYNGSSYIREQLGSILSQLPNDAEVLVGDDGSVDDTLSIIQEFNDPRLKIIRNEVNLGYVRNFESLIERASGDYIFLSDQDDIWPLGRVDRMISLMKESKSLLVVGQIESFIKSVECRTFFCGFKEDRDRSPWRNIVDIFLGRSVPYFGSAMLLSKNIKKIILPLCSSEVSHDIWIALVANMNSSISHLDGTVTYRRVHGSNLTKDNRSFLAKLRTRVVWFFALLKVKVDGGRCVR